MRPYEAYRNNVWRVIEGQYRPATRKIVDTDAEQARLEELLDATKPPMPEPCRALDYQFGAPFRYGVYPGPSRFRRPGRTPGVFYASEASQTAALESAWISIRFFRESPGTPLPENPTIHTAVQAAIAAPKAIDLTKGDMADPKWEHPTNYDACLTLADEVRSEGCEAIRYHSVRDPDRRKNLAILTCQAFASPRPVQLETWRILLTQRHVVLFNETLRQKHEYLICDEAFKAA